ncbi:MAG: hypothetical protein U9O91_07750 [Candidatus Caldatribacteriota bacterium]|nr:hypothetical protein [Candidatus Caldatribacteriota bacterium]
MMNIIKEMPDWEIKKDLTKFLPLNQRTTVTKVKIWLIKKSGERE